MTYPSNRDYCDICCQDDVRRGCDKSSMILAPLILICRVTAMFATEPHRGSFSRLHPAKSRESKRRGAVVVLVALCAVLLLGLIAFAVDLGVLMVSRTELQRTADAAALAGAGTLCSEDRLKGPIYAANLQSLTRLTVADYCQKNPVFNATPTINTNINSRDLIIGRFAAPDSVLPAVSVADANAILVRVHRTGIPTFFGRIFGVDAFQSSAFAIATFRDGIVGFRAPRNGQNNSLMPFAVKIDAFNAILNGSAGTDNYRVDPATGAVTAGTDNIKEMVMFPDRVTGYGITPGNFGTVDVGSYSNSTQDLKRQIQEGVSAEDLAYFGGELKLDGNGELRLNGDTGVSAGMELSVETTIGKGPRTIFLYREVVNPGNTATFVIVGFAAIRVLDCNFNGVHKFVRIQPAVVNDSSAISDNGHSNYSVYQPVIVVR
jgi:hypothetical protein